jgi:ParB family transcriptional regulator, chromosome partitioning protein
VLQPILVRTSDGGQYEIIAGERRWRAAKRAGLQSIPALVREATEVSSIEQALVENLHREDLGPLEEAAAYQQLIEDFGLTHEQLSSRVGKSRAAITNSLRLFQLPPSVQRMVADGQLSAGHARALLGTPDRAFQEALARRASGDGLSVRAVEVAVRDRNELGLTSAPRQRQTRLRPPGILELEGLLSDHLATRVQVDMSNKKGKLVVEFATLEDLERIYRTMTGSPAPEGEPDESL